MGGVYEVMRKFLSEEHKKAWNSFRAQKGRCYDKNNVHYKNYGAKEIIMEYSLDDFTHWWVSKQKDNYIEDATISRLDHDSNYCFENVRLESRSANSKERNARTPQGIKVAALTPTGEHFATFKDSY